MKRTTPIRVKGQTWRVPRGFGAVYLRVVKADLELIGRGKPGAVLHGIDIGGNIDTRRERRFVIARDPQGAFDAWLATYDTRSEVGTGVLKGARSEP